MEGEHDPDFDLEDPRPQTQQQNNNEGEEDEQAIADDAAMSVASKPKRKKKRRQGQPAKQEGGLMAGEGDGDLVGGALPAEGEGEPEGAVDWQSPASMHWIMYQTSIETFCNDEQLKKWGPMTQNFDCIGCYAQTELGHGSDISGLETTALYDKKTDEFILNTPTISSTKWWPGDIGRFANHALVFAQLIIEDEDGEKNNYGVNPFIV